MQQEAEAAKSEGDEELVEDISDTDSPEESNSGRISGSVNHGDVLGDVNAAGIVGSLSVEYDFDPEDDLTQEGNRSLNFQYKTLAVVEGCINDGAVSAKKDYAGGIVGRMDLGAVRTCESYGDVESTGGDYVGGIAGLTRSVIRGCFVKCTLSGGDFVGGVVGMGENGSAVSGCYTMVEISGDGQSHGAISGTETGDFTENRFVSDTLAGLGRISYEGQAEPISFATLAAVPGMPEEMTQFTLRFLVEEEEVKTISFAYGDSFGPDVFPEIPAKDGSYAAWDTEDLTDLRFDKTVTAQYSRYVLTLPSEAARESGRPVFLVDGNFDDNAVLTATAAAQPEPVHGETPLEQWTLHVSDPTQETYTVRYLSPDEDPDGLTVYVRQDNGWVQADCSTFGSYLVFSVPAAEAEVAIIPAAAVWVWWLVGGLALLLFLALLLRIWKKHPKKQQTPAASKPHKVKTPSPKASQPRKKWLLPTILSVVLLLALAGGILAVRFLGAVSEARTALEDFAAQPDAAMTLTVDTELEEQLTHAEMDITKAQVDGHSVACISSNGISLYYADGAVILENGSAYEASSLYPDYSQLPAEAARILQSASATAQRSGGTITCRLTAEGENARALLSLLLPAQSEYLADTQKLTMQLITTGGTFVSLNFDAEGTLTDDRKTTYALSAELTAAEPEEGLVVPDPVVNAVRSEDTVSRAALSEDLVRLITAWTDFRQSASCTSDFTLEAHLGNLSLDETMRYAQTFVEGRKITCIRTGDLTIYGAGGTFCDASGAQLTAAEAGLADRIHLLEVLHQICLSGTFDSVETGSDNWLYTLALDEEGMEKIPTAAVPDAESLSGTLTSGSVQLRLKDGAISEIDCACTGGPDAQVVFSVKLVLTQTDGFDVPAAVLAQLCPEAGQFLPM